MLRRLFVGVPAGAAGSSGMLTSPIAFAVSTLRSKATITPFRPHARRGGDSGPAAAAMNSGTGRPDLTRAQPAAPFTPDPTPPHPQPMATGAPFDDIRLKPFPVRAAIDIGTGGMATLAVAVVDAHQRAIRDLKTHLQLPLLIEFDAAMAAAGRRALSERSRADIIQKCRMLGAAMTRDCPGVTEAAGLLTWPFYECEGADALAALLRAELRADIRVLGATQAPPVSAKRARLDRLLGRASLAADRTAEMGAAAVVPVAGPAEELSRLAFLAIAAAGKVVDASRLVAIIEAPSTLTAADGTATAVFAGGALELVGTDDTATTAAGGKDGEGETSRRPTAPLPAAEAWQAPLRRFPLPLSTMGAQEILLRDVQRRDGARLNAFSSPNPLHRHEAVALRKGLRRALEPAIPSWVHEKLSAGGVVMGASENGGLLNICARLAGHVSIGLEQLEQQVDFGVCGLTDVLLAENYPLPQFVATQGVLGAALMAALRSPRVEYLPRVSIAQALLVHPHFWAYSRAGTLHASLGQEHWFAGGQHARTYSRPQQVDRANPNAPTPRRITANTIVRY